MPVNSPIDPLVWGLLWAAVMVALIAIGGTLFTRMAQRWRSRQEAGMRLTPARELRPGTRIATESGIRIIEKVDYSKDMLISDGIKSAMAVEIVLGGGAVRYVHPDREIWSDLAVHQDTQIGRPSHLIISANRVPLGGGGGVDVPHENSPRESRCRIYRKIS